MPREFTSAVAGVSYPDEKGRPRRFEVLICIPGEPVQLRPEPKNPHDPHAIAIYSVRGLQLGYLPAERAPWIGGKLKLGEDIRAAFQAATEHGALIRINLVGKPPTLPAPVSAERRPIPLIGPRPKRLDRTDGNQLPEIEPEEVSDYIPPDD